MAVVEIFDPDTVSVYTTVKVIPVERDGLTRMMPVLFYRAMSGIPTMSIEALDFAYASAQTHSSGHVLTEIKTLSKLIMFYGAIARETQFGPQHLQQIVYQYLTARLTGSLDENGKCQFGFLHWRPIKYNVVQTEFRVIVRFFAFCAEHYGYIDLSRRFAVRENTPAFKQFYKLAEMRKQDFFAHLSASRQSWKDMMGSTVYKMPQLVGKPPQRNVGVRSFPSTEEVVKIINSTSNPVYKAVFIAAAFGGLRVSEILNAWACDVLPGIYRKQFFQEYSQTENHICLFLKPDPVHSTFCGQFGDTSQTRQQYLNAEYGLVPRNMLHCQDKLYAGWKGTRYSGGQNTHQVFWVDYSAAERFKECCDEIKIFIGDVRAQHRHPYLFINMADRTQKHLGNPTTIKQIQKAFERACKRCGIIPNKFGRNIHGLRHHYKWMAQEQLGLSREHVQVMMGHASIESQEAYGRDAKGIFEQLTERRRIAAKEHLE